MVRMRIILIGLYTLLLMIELFAMILSGKIRMIKENLIHMSIKSSKKLKNGEINFSKNTLFREFCGGINSLIQEMIKNYSKIMKW